MRRQILTAKSGISNHAVAGMEEIREFCFKEFAAVCLFWNFLFSSIPIILVIKPKNDILIAAIPFCLLYYSRRPRKISLRSTSSASSFPSALACSSGYFDPVRSISITDA